MTEPRLRRIVEAEGRCEMKKISGGETAAAAAAAQTRVSRYKEERRKQLANQFANLVALPRNYDYDGTCASALTSSDASRKTAAFKSHNLIVVQDDEARRPKLSNHYRQTNVETRRKYDASEDVTTATAHRTRNIRKPQQKSNGISAADSNNACTATATSTTKTASALRSDNGERDKKRKSQSNGRSANYDKTTGVNHRNYHSNHNTSNNHHAHSHSADESTLAKKWNSRVTVHSSLPLPVTAAAGTTTTSSSSFTSSHKTKNASPNGSRQKLLSLVDSQSATATVGSCNGVEAAACENTDSPAMISTSWTRTKEENFFDAKETSGSRIPRRISGGSMCIPQDEGGSSVESPCARTDDATGVEFAPRDEQIEYKNRLPETTASDDGRASNGHRTEAELPEQTYESSPDSVNLVPSPNVSLEIIEENATTTPKQSILKKKFDKRSNSLDASKPNSILKRKNFEDCCVAGKTTTTAATTSVSSRQGILKKYYSFDEEEVRRRSSSSETDAGKLQEFKPILKPGRRSSLEELTQNQCPELHSILKRSKAQHEENYDVGATAARSSILKRKAFGANAYNSYNDRSGGSVEETTTMESGGAAKPILKNKQTHAPDLTTADRPYWETTPKPILKKKASSENDTDEDKPKRPILKSSRKSLDEEMANVSIRETAEPATEASAAIKPILKKNYADTRGVKSDDDSIAAVACPNRVKRNSLPGIGTFVHAMAVAENDGKNSRFDAFSKSECRDTRMTAAKSVEIDFEGEESQLAAHLDEILSTKSTMEEKRGVKKLSKTNAKKDEKNDDDTSLSAANATKITRDVVDDETEKSNDRDVMSKLKRSNSVSMKASLFSQLEKDGKKAAEATKVKKKADVVGKRKLKVKCSDLASRFSTQPITWEEVAEAKKQNQIGRNKLADIKNEIIKNSLTASWASVERASDDGAVYLSISERVKLFTEKAATAEKDGDEATIARTRTVVERTHNNRFKTQPVTFEEVEMAKVLAVNANRTAVESGKIPVIGVKVMEKPKTSSSTVARSTETKSELDNREIRSSATKKTQPEKKTGASKHGGDPIMNFGSIVTDDKDVVDDGTAVARINGNSSIAQRRAALEKSGQVDWKKRISRFDPENEVPQFINVNETQDALRKELSNGCRNKKLESANERGNNDGTLADRLEKLENARETWKNRVEPSDAAQFSVAGKMVSLTPVPTKTSASSPPSERKKRTPCPSRFRSFREHRKDVHSDPSSPLKSKSTAAVVCRSNSLPSEHTDDDDEKGETAKHDSIVNVPQIFDEQFAAFFGTAETKTKAAAAVVDFNADFGDIKIDTSKMLRTGRRIKAQRKHGTSGNPLKTMAARIDIKNEYTEVKATAAAANVAEREMKRANVEKFAKNSTLAVEALAGLASKEDFQSVQLKKAAPLSSPMLPYKPLMLLHVKGRRHVQTRLVEPVIESINSGDSYVLVTPNEVYHWIGKFSNVIEKSRGAEIAQHVVATHDLGCVNATTVVTVQEDAAKTNSRAVIKFWTLLGATPEQAKTIKAVEGGHPDEDEEYENSLLSTNMIYEVNENELVPVEKYWATIPKIQMLDPNKVFVLDFGSELYVWMGKNVDLKLRKWSTQLAKELWENGFNYEECDLCPITSSFTIGMRNENADEGTKRGTERPDWCLFAKVTQHMETVLFREKFVDWPDFTRVIRAKGKDEDTERQADSSFDMSACDVVAMLEEKCAEPDLVLEGSHLGRGDKFFEEELRRYFVVKTSDVRMWHIAEFESELVPNESLGQFYSTDSYVVRWLYSVSSTGRELSGLPSKHTTTGRDRCVYFCWQGKNASLNEQGAAALLTVELDKEKGQQLRICQGYEPPAFFRLFAGKTVVYKSKTSVNSKGWRLFVCRGEIEEEAALLEVTCNVKQLRSRACCVLVNAHDATAYVWNGCKADKRVAKVCECLVNRLKEAPPPELGLRAGTNLKITVVDEGREPKEFFAGLGGSSKKMYWSLLDDKNDYGCTPLLFGLSSNSGSFCATPVWSSCRHKDIVTAYPFLQEDLYAAHQPALFLLDTGKQLWLWQGWWPERAKTSESEEDSDNRRGSATVRWQAERRAAMQTALNYWKRKYGDKPTEAYLVWAGLEPVQFTNLFPDWEDRDDVTEINISDGRKPGELLDIKQELERLTQSTYPIEQLLQRPLPDGVDPTKLELYLSASHFEEILKVSKEEFVSLPSWKQTNLKKNAGLF